MIKISELLLLLGLLLFLILCHVLIKDDTNRCARSGWSMALFIGVSCGSLVLAFNMVNQPNDYDLAKVIIFLFLDVFSSIYVSKYIYKYNLDVFTDKFFLCFEELKQYIGLLSALGLLYFGIKFNSVHDFQNHAWLYIFVLFSVKLSFMISIIKMTKDKQNIK